MYLKDAFRYQNTLSRLTDQTVAFLSKKANITVTKQEHMRKKVNHEAENETVEVERDRGIEPDNNAVIAFLEYLLGEKVKLSAAISRAKAGCGFDLDAELSNNKVRQRVAECLNAMARTRAEERTVTGRGYKFNADGEQVSYTYDVKQVTSIDFDRNTARNGARKHQEEADKISARIDRMMVDVEVGYEPAFAPTDTFEDAIASWAEDNKTDGARDA